MIIVVNIGGGRQERLVASLTGSRLNHLLHAKQKGTLMIPGRQVGAVA